MKTYSIKYKDYDTLKKYISNNDVMKCNNILVQVFSGIGKKEFIEEVIKNITLLIPQCKIIGATSAGEILNGKIFENECLISISVFEKTTLETILIKEKISDFNKGVEIAHKLISQDTKVIISFCDESIDGKDFLDGINSINNKIIIAGGIAGNSNSTDDTYVFSENGIEKDSVVAVALRSKELYVNNESNFNWVPVGKEYEITDAEGNVIKTIDNVPAQEFYSKYLGTNNDEQIELIGSKFPLMVKRNNTYSGKTVIKYLNDKEIITSSSIDIGEKIRIGYGNFREILMGSKSMYEKIKEYPGESLFIYSCDSRKKFLRGILAEELAPISNDLSTSGFYTCGEFNYINNKNTFYNETMTVLVLSEDVNSRIKIDTENANGLEYYSAEDLALYNLIRTTGDELHNLNLKLEKKIAKKTEELEKQYYNDKLTGLENRNKLIIDLSKGKYNKLVIIDIKSFNGINDFYGNIVGDTVLKALSKLISLYCEKNNLNSYRVSSDIFAVVDNIGLKEEFIERIKLLQDIINNQCIYYEEGKIYITVTMGLALEQEALFEKAEMASHYAKKNKKLFQIYKEELNIYEGIKENIIWTKKIKDAIADNRIVPFFQPIVNNNLGTIEKYEALIRMIDESGKVISPYFFLEIAKKSGLYKELTRIMLEKVFEVLNKTDYEISINILLQDIMNVNTRTLIIEKLKKAKNSKKVIFEIVESEGIENFKEVADFIKEIKKYGSKIAIDDFGTGYSNFYYLMKLNVDYIKIDGSIIKNIHKDKSAEVVTKTIVAFAKELGIETIAEFVAEEEIYNKIKELNIGYSQGYYFSEPKESIE